MSHEGIRFISQDEAQRLAAGNAPKLTGDAIKPAKVRVDVTGGTGVGIDWKDGHRSAWSFPWLRLACPCATCHEEREKTGRALGAAVVKPATLLPMYEAPPRPVEVTPVGKYAIRFKWSDGHEAGLYSWDYLRNVCDRAGADQKL
jgi:DUF971 family protein